ncbi:hypothetical protein EP331_08830 [bacterium]|nr:MAG: hypothetical protein EP331_08830 [bacterium]
MLYIVVFFSVLLLALGLTHMSILFARTHNINDHPDEYRKFHPNPTPSTGGLAIGIAFLIGLLVMNSIQPSKNEAINNFLWYFFAGSLIVFITGVIDDIIGLSSKPKFLLQTLAAVVTILGLKLEFFPHFGKIDEITFWAALGLYSVIWFWIVANSNMINLIDGVDGLASTISLTVLFGLMVISFYWQVDEANMFIIPLAAAIIGFLAFNKPPASVFMGDTGSLLIGYAISVIALVAAFHAPHWKYTFALILLPAVPAIDTLFSIIRRTKNGINPFESDHSHIHHIFQKYFKSPALTDITLGTVSLIFVLSSILLANTKDDVLYFTVLAVFLLLVVVVSVIYYFKMDSINSIVLNDELNRKIIRRITNGKRVLPKKENSDDSLDNYIKTFKN